MTFVLKENYFILLSIIFSLIIVITMRFALSIGIFSCGVISSGVAVCLYKLLKSCEPIYIVESGYLKIIVKNVEKKYLLSNVKGISYYDDGCYLHNSFYWLYEGESILVYKSAKSSEGVSIEKYLVNECGIFSRKKRK